MSENIKNQINQLGLTEKIESLIITFNKLEVKIFDQPNSELSSPTKEVINKKIIEQETAVQSRS